MAKKKAAGTSSKSAKPEKANEKVSFEALMAELEQTIAELESGELGLQEALEKYEKGIHCLKDCYQELKNAEQKIEMLSSIDESGQIRVVPFGNDTKSQ